MIPEFHFPFKCSFCILNFASRSELSSHVMHHFKQKPCQSCDQTVFQIGDDWYELRLHKHEGYNDTEISVDIKPELSIPTIKMEEWDENSFSHERILDEESHQEEDFTNPSYMDSEDITKVDVDSKKISHGSKPKSTDKKEQHKRSAHLSIECDICNDMFSERAELLRHMKKAHIQKTPYKCNLCDETFDEQKGFKAHKSQVHDGKTFLCKTCGESFQARRDLISHNASHLNTGPVICNVCGKKLKSQITLKIHMFIHNGQHKCGECNRCFSSPANLKSHIQCTHEKKLLYTCDTCGKSFSNNGNLRTHKNQHSAVRRRWVCHTCGNTYHAKFALNEHMNTHSGYRPYVCKICGKAFCKRVLLDKHNRIHTQDRRYKCHIEGCVRAYIDQIDLKRHLYGQHGIYSKKHVCSICSKVYPENKLLKKHMESH